jgi:hypothetical protein
MKIIITELQFKRVVNNILNEEIPYNIAKKYLKIGRSPQAEQRIKKIFDNLKLLPKSRQIDNQGQRISFPYSEDSSESEIENTLKRYQFTIKDYKNNLAIDIKNNQEIKLTKALNIISKKEPDVKELIDRYTTIKSKGVIDKDENLMIVFSSNKYDIIGMSTDRIWDSCMNIISGGNRKYVKIDIEKGTIICYLTKVNDTNIENPLGRVLIKPYINIENEEDVVLYAENRTYGNIPNTDFFISIIDNYLEKTQNLLGTYKRLGCLYSDSDRLEIKKREDIEKILKQKLEKKDYNYIRDFEFLYLPIIKKRNLLDIYLSSDFIPNLTPIHVKYMSQSQKITYFKSIFKDFKYKIQNMDPLIFREAPLIFKKEIIDFKIENNNFLSDNEYKIATPEQKEKFIKEYYYIRFNNKIPIPENIFIGAPENVKKEYIDLLQKNNQPLQKYHYKNATPEQKEKYIRMVLNFKKKDQIFTQFPEDSDYFVVAPEDVKKDYIDLKLKNNYYLNDNELNSTTPKQKQIYFNFLKEKLKLKLTDISSLNKHEFDLLTPEQKQKHNNLLLSKIYDTIKPLPYNGFGYVENRLQPHELDLLTPEQKQKYIDLLLSHKFNLLNYEDMVATKNQKNKNKILHPMVLRQRMGIIDPKE